QHSTGRTPVNSRSAPEPEPTRTPSTSPETTGHHLGRDHFTEAEERSERLVGSGLSSQALVQVVAGSSGTQGLFLTPGACAAATSARTRWPACPGRPSTTTPRPPGPDPGPLLR